MAPIATADFQHSPALAGKSNPTESAPANGEKEVTAMVAMAHQGKALPSIPKFTSYVAQRQWQLEHMAGAFRVFARDGFAEGISGHISVRDPEFEDRFWINPLGVHFGMLKASDMVLVDFEGNPVGGNKEAPINAAGFLIHVAIHKARPDVHSICHTHSIHGRAWSAFARPLEMLNQDVCNFYKAHSVYADYGGIVLASDEGVKIAAALGQSKAAILMNHGLLTVGGTVDEAAYLFVLMERCCKVQLLIEAAGLEKNLVPDEEAAYNFKMASDPEALYCEFQSHLNYEQYMSGGDFRG